MITDIEKTLLDLVDEFETGMLLTRDGPHITGRPMSVADFDESTGNITFSTSLETDKVSEIEREPRCAVVFQSLSTQVSLSGTATISNDRQRIKQLFSDAWQLWYPEGPDQADIRLIVFKPQRGEYWDYSGVQGLKFGWKAIKAFSKGERVEVDDNASHAQTNL